MSRASRHPNDYQSAKEYVEWLVSLGVFTRLYISGSRSPAREKQPHQYSDWDFTAITNREGLSIPNPRATGALHGDVQIFHERDEHKRHAKAVEVWPTDEYGVFAE